MNWYFFCTIEVDIGRTLLKVIPTILFRNFHPIRIRRFLPDINFKKILDLGANYGYFSLWIQTINPDIKISSLMISPQRTVEGL